MKLLTLLLTLLIAQLCYAEKAEWTYAFYLASGDGFYTEQNKNFLEICKGAENVKNANVIVFVDVKPEKGKISALKLSKGTYAFEVKSCNNTKQIYIPEIGLSKDKSVSIDSSDPKVIKAFFDHVREKYPSWKSFYDITAHGETTIDPSKGSINSISISKALAGNKPDVLALDMCYMGSIESLWMLRKSATFIISASTTIPLSVNDYGVFLQKAGTSNLAPIDAAKAFVESYKETYADNRYPISVFAIETGDIFENFVAVFNSRASCFPKKLDRFDVIKPKQSAKSNLYGTNTDLLKGLEIVNKSVMKKLEKSVVASFSINTDFTGPALFLPIDSKTYEKHRNEYRETGFAKDNADWSTFLDILYKHK